MGHAMSQAESAARRIEQYQRESVKFLTKIATFDREPELKAEDNAPLLNCPRITITVQEGTDLQTIRDMFDNPVLYELWFAKSGSYHLKQGLLVE